MSRDRRFRGNGVFAVWFADDEKKKRHFCFESAQNDPRRLMTNETAIQKFQFNWNDIKSQ